jgi:hypothetical protein
LFLESTDVPLMNTQFPYLVCGCRDNHLLVWLRP